MPKFLVSGKFFASCVVEAPNLEAAETRAQTEDVGHALADSVFMGGYTWEVTDVELVEDEAVADVTMGV